MLSVGGMEKRVKKRNAYINHIYSSGAPECCYCATWRRLQLGNRPTFLAVGAPSAPQSSNPPASKSKSNSASSSSGSTSPDFLPPRKDHRLVFDDLRRKSGALFRRLAARSSRNGPQSAQGHRARASDSIGAAGWTPNIISQRNNTHFYLSELHRSVFPKLTPTNSQKNGYPSAPRYDFLLVEKHRIRPNHDTNWTEPIELGCWLAIHSPLIASLMENMWNTALHRLRIFHLTKRIHSGERSHHHH